jgi:CRP-like cAMP-binding protein
MTLKAGDCIGELDMLGDKNIKYSAVAVESCDLWYLDLEGMRRNFYVILNNKAIYHEI